MAGYDRAITVFSPDGQLLQVQYAQQAVKKCSSAIGIRGSDVVVLAVEKRALHKLQEKRTEKKIVSLDKHIVLTYSGLRADARALIASAQIECQTYRLAADDPVTVGYIARYMAGKMQNFTQYNGRRPFGVSCLVGGFDSDGTPHLYQTEPSGIYYEWKASSAGRYDSSTREFLEKHYTPEAVATDRGAIKLAIRTLLEIVQSTQSDIEVAVLKNGQPVRMLEQDAIASVAAEIEKNKIDAEKK